MAAMEIYRDESESKSDSGSDFEGFGKEDIAICRRGVLRNIDLMMKIMYRKMTQN